MVTKTQVLCLFIASTSCWTYCNAMKKKKMSIKKYQQTARELVHDIRQLPEDQQKELRSIHEGIISQQIHLDPDIEKINSNFIRTTYNMVQVNLWRRRFDTTIDELVRIVGATMTSLGESNKITKYSIDIAPNDRGNFLADKKRIYCYGLVHMLLPFSAVLCKQEESAYSKFGKHIVDGGKSIKSALTYLQLPVKENRANPDLLAMLSIAVNVADMMSEVKRMINTQETGALVEQYRKVITLIEGQYMPLAQKKVSNWNTIKKGFFSAPLPEHAMRTFEYIEQNIHHPNALELYFTYIDEKKKIKRPSHTVTQSPSQPIRVRDDKTEIEWELLQMPTPPQIDHTLNFSNIQYTQSIIDWIDNPEKILASTKFNNINKSRTYVATHEKRADAIQIHTFPLELDKHIKQYGIITRAKDNSNDYVAILPCCMNKQDTQKIGYLMYRFSAQTGQCYHRNFVEAPNNDEIIKHYLGIEDLSNPTLYDIAFPPLDKEKK